MRTETPRSGDGRGACEGNSRVVSLGANLMPASGGTYRTVLDFETAFSGTAVDHRALNFCNAEPAVSQGRMLDIRMTQSWTARRYLWLGAGRQRQLESLLSGANLLFIHGIFIDPLLRAASWARSNGVPYVVIPHGSLDPYVFSYRSLRKRLWMNLYGRRMLQHAARVLFATIAERDKALYSKNVRPAVIQWSVPHVPDHDKDSFAAEMCRTLGLPPKQRIALFCGRLHPMKRPLETIQAFLKVAPPNWTLLVVGPPSPEIPLERVQKIAGESGRRIRVIGPVYGKPLWDFYRAANLLLLFSRRENFGLVVAEALACGTPVAVTDRVDLSGSITDHRCGFVLREYSDDHLNQALHSVLRIDPRNMIEMGLRGREWARQDLSMESFRRNLIELSKSVAPFQPEVMTLCTP